MRYEGRLFMTEEQEYWCVDLHDLERLLHVKPEPTIMVAILSFLVHKMRTHSFVVAKNLEFVLIKVGFNEPLPDGGCTELYPSLGILYPDEDDWPNVEPEIQKIAGDICRESSL